MKTFGAYLFSVLCSLWIVTAAYAEPSIYGITSDGRFLKNTDLDNSFSLVQNGTGFLPTELMAANSTGLFFVSFQVPSSPIVHADLNLSSTIETYYPGAVVAIYATEDRLYYYKNTDSVGSLSYFDLATDDNVLVRTGLASGNNLVVVGDFAYVTTQDEVMKIGISSPSYDSNELTTYSNGFTEITYHAGTNSLFLASPSEGEIISLPIGDSSTFATTIPEHVLDGLGLPGKLTSTEDRVYVVVDSHTIKFFDPTQESPLLSDGYDDPYSVKALSTTFDKGSSGPGGPADDGGSDTGDSSDGGGSGSTTGGSGGTDSGSGSDGGTGTTDGGSGSSGDTGGTDSGGSSGGDSDGGSGLYRDKDGDGVPDSFDGCPNNFYKVAPDLVCDLNGVACKGPLSAVYENGVASCEEVDPNTLDPDGDGVKNGADACPADGLKAASEGICGCFMQQDPDTGLCQDKIAYLTTGETPPKPRLSIEGGENTGKYSLTVKYLLDNRSLDFAKEVLTARRKKNRGVKKRTSISLNVTTVKIKEGSSKRDKVIDSAKEKRTKTIKVKGDAETVYLVDYTIGNEKRKKQQEKKSKWRPIRNEQSAKSQTAVTSPSGSLVNR